MRTNRRRSHENVLQVQTTLDKVGFRRNSLGKFIHKGRTYTLRGMLKKAGLIVEPSAPPKAGPIGPRAKRRPFWRADARLTLADMSRRNRTKERRLRGRRNQRSKNAMWG